MSARQYRGDAQVLTQPGPNRKPHPQHQWDKRCPPGWRGYNVRAAWREGEPYDPPGYDAEAYARYHSPSGMCLVASWGCLQTAYRLSTDVPPAAQEMIREQLEAETA